MVLMITGRECPESNGDITTKPLSFRDPDGQVVWDGGEFVTRMLTPSGCRRIEAIEALSSIRKFQSQGLWVDSVPDPADTSRRLHTRVFFPSYPWEWSWSMLRRAGQLTLAVNMALLEEGWELKDGTPSNVLFQGSTPIFVDHLSPVERIEGQLGWSAYGQFVRNFLIPLLLEAKTGFSTRLIFYGQRDGLPPEQALSMFPMASRLAPSVWQHVTLPCLLQKLGPWIELQNMATLASSEVAVRTSRAILNGLVSRLAKLRKRSNETSIWLNYQDAGISYSTKGFDEKEAILEQVLRKCEPRTVLDLGCNTGRHARLAALGGASVVAVDSDPSCVDRVFLQAEKENLDILPLVMDLGRPSPTLGWGCEEHASFLQRAEGRFDLILALALMHHLLIRERAPLDAIARFFAKISKRFLLLEWVPPEDPQFMRLAGKNLDLYKDLTWPQVVQVFSPWFEHRAAYKISDQARSIHLFERVRAAF